MPTSTSKRSKTAKSSPTKKPAKAGASKPPANADGITNYTTGLKWLMGHIDHERMRIVKYDDKTFSLDRMRKLLKLMGNPHEALQCIQVVGTKGKGSTCAMLASMLEGCGYTVGLYTSPHLVDVRERIVINGQIISHADAADLLAQVSKAEEKMGDDKPTYFEILTAMALKYYADEAVDVVVLEAGLGGRLDSTTVITPLAVGVTNISLDHTNILGKDLASIAREKAGAFKKGVPVISVDQDASVTPVLNEIAEKVGTTVHFTGQQIDFSYRFEANRELGPHTRVSVTTEQSKWEHLPVPLKGEHQAHNCGLALALLDKLKLAGFEIPEDKAIQGLAKTVLAGRMEEVWKEPRVLVDGAHNAQSIQALIRAMGAHIAYDSLVVVFGCGQDKDVEGMLKQLALGADKIVFTRAKGNPRAVEPEDLMSKFIELTGKMAQIAPTLEDALRLSARAVSREDLIVVTGSFYLVGEAKKYFNDLGNKKKN
jgi:dihydrofolate synthase/folylpolyglutamate synthase